MRAAFEKFRGDFYQMPPMVSAIKKGGVPLYKLARQGKTVEREPRLVHVYSYDIDRIASPEIDFTVICSKGFYVRTYAHDIGEALGCGAHLKDLRRTKSGRFDLAGAITVDEIKTVEPVDILAKDFDPARGLADAGCLTKSALNDRQWKSSSIDCPESRAIPDRPRVRFFAPLASSTEFISGIRRSFPRPRDTRGRQAAQLW